MKEPRPVHSSGRERRDTVVTDFTELVKRIRILEDTEAIKKLKAKYWRCIDRKLWDELEECFTEDVIVDYGPDMQFRGREAVLGFFRDALGKDSVVTVHAGYGAEIEILGETTARGVWALHDRVTIEPESRLKGWGHYEDEYIKEEGKWKIKFTNLSRLRQELTTFGC